MFQPTEFPIPVARVVEHFQVSKVTLRYWERIGLLSPTRTDRNHRTYPATEIVKIGLIMKCRDRGVREQDIKAAIMAEHPHVYEDARR